MPNLDQAVATLPIIAITPEMATEWLNANKGNRKLRAGIVEKYADDMRTGRWTRCHVPIQFYEDGDLADGQHRLWAIVESNTTQHFPVVHGLSRIDGLNIDTGATRSLLDASRIAGINNHLSTQLLSACRSIAIGNYTGKGSSNAQKLDLVSRHYEAGRWVCTHGTRGKNLMNGAIMGAVGRAWYHVADKDKLKRFCDVVTTGFSNGTHESAAVAIRNYLMSTPAAATNAMWRDTFLRVQFSIKKFIAGESMTVVRPIKEECFPLTEMKQAA